jgi:hypothetical protein
VRAWKTLAALPANDSRLWPGFFDWPEPASRILAAMRAGMHDRINQAIPACQRGRRA